MIKSFYNRFQTKALFQKAIKGIAFLSSEKLIKIFIGLFVHALVARYLTPEGYGKLSYVLNFGLAFIPFVLLGIDDVVTKDLVDQESSREEIVNDIFGYRLIGAAVGFLVLNAFNFMLMYENNFELFTYIGIYSFFLFINVFYVFELPFLSELNTRTIFMARTSAYLTGTAGRILGCLLKFKLIYFVLSYYLDELIHKSYIFLSYVRHHKFRPDFSLSSYKKDLFAKSWPLFLVLFLTMLEQRIPYYFLEEMGDEKLLGFFSVSFTLIDLWMFVPSSICTVIYPIMVRNKRENEALYQERSRFLMESCIWLGLGLVLGVHVTSPYVISLLYGAKYAGAETVLNTLSFAALIFFFNISRVKIFTIEGKIKVWISLFCLSLLIFTAELVYLKSELTMPKIIGAYFVSHFLANFIMSFFEPLVKTTFLAFFKSIAFPVRILTKKN